MATQDKTTGSPPMIGRVLDRPDWQRYCEAYEFGSVWPNKVILHHTAVPTLEQWKGLRSMRSMQAYYQRLGWSAAPHIYTGPDGIWLFTPMSRVGVHARECNETRNVRRVLTGYSIGVEMVGNYTAARPTGEVWENTLSVLGELCLRLGTEPRKLISFHRYCGKPECPGDAVTDEWVYSEVEKWLRPRKDGGLAAYYAQAGADIHQGPGEEFPVVRTLPVGAPVLVDTFTGEWVHMVRFPPMFYDEGFVLERNLKRVY